MLQVLVMPKVLHLCTFTDHAVLFGFPRQIINHSLEKLKVIYSKHFSVYARINYHFKTNEMKN